VTASDPDPAPDRAAPPAPGGPRPVIFGELLFDRFPDGRARLGGAPLNVAAHLAAFGARPLLVSRVGDDDAGRNALEALARLGVDRAAVQIDPRLPTGEVRVELDGSEPRFEILPDRAWDAIEPGPALAALASVDPALLYHGTLAARSETSRAALLALADTIDAPRFVDANLRPPWTPRATARELARGARWLKLGRAELAEWREHGTAAEDLDATARRLAEALGVESIAVSLGDAGARLYEGDGPPLVAAAPRLAPGTEADAVGAGDGFAAISILGLLCGWSPGVRLERAVRFASAICTRRGALPDAPAFYEPFHTAWDLDP